MSLDGQPDPNGQASPGAAGPAAHDPPEDAPILPVRPWRIGLVGLLILAAAGVAVVHGISARAHTETDLKLWASEQAPPTVALVAPTADTRARQLTLPGTIEAYYTAPIYPRVTGYVKSWNTDIGARVNRGQELAMIDTPDLDQQLIQAQANLASAVAEEQLAAVTATRWSRLLQSQTVSQQDENERAADALSKQAAVEAAKANVGQLEAFQNYKRIVAPFDGIVTARHADIGDLVSAGSGGSPLFQISDVRKVRVYVQVPQAFSAEMQPGLTALLSLPQYPDQSFQAKLVTTANAFDEASRTVQVELQADNADNKLWPGTFVEVSFQLPAAAHVLRVPATALVLDANGVRVALLGEDGKVTFKDVTLGRNLGDQAEVLSGLSLSDKLINSPPEWLSEGDAVHIASGQAK